MYEVVVVNTNVDITEYATDLLSIYKFNTSHYLIITMSHNRTLKGSYVDLPYISKSNSNLSITTIN